MHLLPQQRVEAYRESEEGKKYPDSCPYLDSKGRIMAMWIMGQNYRARVPYYGAHPTNYLKRMEAFFPDAKRVLHLFSGSLPPGNYTRMDRLSNDIVQPDVVGDAENLLDYFEPGSFDLIYADPPYSVDDAERYSAALCNKKKVYAGCLEVLVSGGWLVWLDQSWPMYSKKEWRLAGMIGIARSTNHRFRQVVLSEKW